MDSNHNDFLEKLRSVDPDDFERDHYGHPIWARLPPSALRFSDRESIDNAVKEIKETGLQENDSHTVKTPGHRLLDRVERLERKIDHIFGDHVLIRGQWVPKSKLIIEDDEQG